MSYINASNNFSLQLPSFNLKQITLTLILTKLCASKFEIMIFLIIFA
jgi:hypothetical protein